MSESKVSAQSGKEPKPPALPKPIMESVRASKPGLPYSGAPGHSMPR